MQVILTDRLIPIYPHTINIYFVCGRYKNNKKNKLQCVLKKPFVLTTNMSKNAYCSYNIIQVIINIILLS